MASLPANKSRSTTTVLEIGAGTGQIGQYFLGEHTEYTGLDIAAEMLDVFKSRLTQTMALSKNQFRLFRADANQPWAIEDQTIDIIFSSRTVHLLDPKHVCSELDRVGSKSGYVFVVGRRQRDRENVAAIMRKQMRRILNRQGFAGRSGDANRQQLKDILVETLDADICQPLTVADWTTTRSAEDSIEAWQGKVGIAGIELDSKTKDSVLVELQGWAKEHLGDLAEQHAVRESYVLDIHRIRGRTRKGVTV